MAERYMAQKLNKRKVRLHLLETRRIPRRKGRFPLPNPSSWKESKAYMTKMQTTLTSNDFDFIVAALNDASLEIEEK
jgi:hypothetical protein